MEEPDCAEDNCALERDAEKGVGDAAVVLKGGDGAGVWANDRRESIEVGRFSGYGHGEGRVGGVAVAAGAGQAGPGHEVGDWFHRPAYRGVRVRYSWEMATLPATEMEIDRFLAAFEGCTLPKERWTHGAHLLAGACYVHTLGPSGAIDRMRRCIKRYNESVGGKNTDTSGYHETITIAWIKLLDGLLRDAGSNATGAMERAAFARLAVERFAGDRDIFKQYYDFDLVGSVEARRSWVEPTLARFD